jgi:putative transposase
VMYCRAKSLAVASACSLVDLNRSLYYYHLKKPRLHSDQKLVKQIIVLRERHRAIGAKKLAKLLSNKNVSVNHKRVARVLKENGLIVIQKRRSRRHRMIDRLPTPSNITETKDTWSIDFMCTRKTNAFKFMLLNVINVGTRISPLMTIERSFTSFDVTDELEKAFLIDGKPARIITDNGAEFTSSHFKVWCKRNDIVHHLTNLGSPAENCFVESFNSSVRREVLDSNDFKTMNELRKKIRSWREYYNSVRPHGSLGYQSPENYNNLAKTLEIAV